MQSGTQIIVHSTSQCSITWSSGEKLGRMEQGVDPSTAPHGGQVKNVEGMEQGVDPSTEPVWKCKGDVFSLSRLNGWCIVQVQGSWVQGILSCISSCTYWLFQRAFYMAVCTLWASLSGTFFQTLPDLVTPLKGHSLSPHSCPATQSAPSKRFGYLYDCRSNLAPKHACKLETHSPQ